MADDKLAFTLDGRREAMRRWAIALTLALAAVATPALAARIVPPEDMPARDWRPR